MNKRIVSLILLLSLMLPMSIGMAHAFHDHDNTICSALGEKHIHKETIDCDQLHYFSQTPSHEVWTDIPVINVYWASIDDVTYATLFTFNLDETDLDRGPPFFNV